MIHILGGSWDGIPFHKNSDKHIKYNGEWLTWIPVLRDYRHRSIPGGAQVRATLAFRDIAWMGVTF